MGRFTKRLVVGLAGALALAGGAFADSVVDDFEKGGNENKFGAYWYFYTNLTACAKGNSPKGCDVKTFTDYVTADKIEVISNAEKDGTQLKFKGGYDSKLTDPHGGLYSGVMQFSNLQEPWSSDINGNSWEDVYPGVGMGTQLTTDSLKGVGADFSNATAIKFWMKTSAGLGQVTFKVETAAMSPTYSHATAWTDGKCTESGGKKSGDCGVKKDCPADAAYQYAIPATDLSNTWKQYTVPLEVKKGGLVREDWEEKYKPFDFKLSEVTKIAWSVDGKTAGVSEGWIAVDDIEVVGYNFVDQWSCKECVLADVSKAPPTGAALFTNFDDLAAPGNISMTQNRFGEYWYGYTDVEGRKGQGTPSEITAGQWDDPNYTEGLSLEVMGMGYGYNSTDGALIQFTMGEAYDDAEKNKVQPFVGIGTNLAPEGEYYDGTQLGSIWFRYRTSGFDELYVEVHDEYAATHDDAEVFYIKIAGTAGAWKTAEIPLSKLRLPKWAKNRTGSNATLNKAKLAKIQLKNQSPQNGSIQIDDVYLLDPTITSVKLVGSKAKAAGLKATYNRGKVGVNWSTASSVASGKIQLVNTKGRVVASAPISTAAGKITANLGAGTIPTGMYFVRVNAKDVNGKKIVQQTPVSIVK